MCSLHIYTVLEPASTQLRVGKDKALFCTWKSVPAIVVAAIPILLETKALEKHHNQESQSESRLNNISKPIPSEPPFSAQS